MSRPLAIALALMAMVVGALLLQRHARQQRASEDFPDGTYWLCRDCGQGFNKSLDELGTWHRQHFGPPPCPACGKTNSVRAYHCSHVDCGAYFTNALQRAARPACPKCGRDL
jgi:hypothetical protein